MLLTAGLIVVSALGRYERAWISFQSKLYRSQTLYVRVVDHLAKDAKTEYWARKPNFIKIKGPDGTITLGIGKKFWERAPGKEWQAIDTSQSGAPNLPNAFDGFWERLPRDLYITIIDSGQTSYLGKTVQTFGVKTTESAIFYGYDTCLYPSGQPIRHHGQEYNDTTTEDTYDRVIPGIKIGADQFKAPVRVN